MTNFSDQVAHPSELVERIARYDRALETRDMDSLQDMIASDFIVVSPAAIRKTRADWFNWFDTIAHYEEMRREIYSVYPFAGSAVILSQSSPLMRLRGGEPAVHAALTLDVWAQREEGWQLAVTQYTRGPQGMPGGTVNS